MMIEVVFKDKIEETIIEKGNLITIEMTYQSLRED